MPTEGLALMTYTVRAARWAHGWELDIEGVGVTQSHNLAGAEEMVRDYLSADIGDAAAATVEVRIVPDLGGIERVAAEVRDTNAALAKAVTAAGERSREVAQRLLDEGLTGSDAAAVLGVSKQRLSQLRRRAPPALDSFRSEQRRS